MFFHLFIVVKGVPIMLITLSHHFLTYKMNIFWEGWNHPHSQFVLIGSGKESVVSSRLWHFGVVATRSHSTPDLGELPALTKLE